MDYMVMECHPAYCVVLSSDGRFIKAANMNYAVGQTVTDIIPMKIPAKKRRRSFSAALSAIAACLIIMVSSLFALENMTVGSVYMSINPHVRIDVNRDDRVVGVEGVNEDGDELISEYEFKRKDLDTVMDELVELACDMGYLHEGGKVTISLDSKQTDWITAHEETIAEQITNKVSESVTVTIEANNTAPDDAIIIPVIPDTDYGNSDYGETDFDDVTDYEETDYDTTEDSGNDDLSDNDTDMSDYGEIDYGASDYDDIYEDTDISDDDFYDDDDDDDETESDYGTSNYD